MYVGKNERKREIDYMCVYTFMQNECIQPEERN